MSSPEAQVPAPPPARRSSILRALLVVVFAFVGGIATGIVGDRAYLVMHERIVPRGGIEFIGKHLLNRLDRALDLTDAQEAQVRAIIERRTKRMRVKWDELHATLHSEFSATHAEISQVLTPEQRVKFERMQRGWHGRRRPAQ